MEPVGQRALPALRAEPAEPEVVVGEPADGGEHVANEPHDEDPGRECDQRDREPPGKDAEDPERERERGDDEGDRSRREPPEGDVAAA